MSSWKIKSKVTLPNGRTFSASVSSVAIDGYRRAYINYPDKHGKQRCISGRVPSHCTYTTKEILFEVNTHSKNAHLLLGKKHKVDYTKPEQFVTSIT